MNLAKKLNSNIICIAGGYHFGNAINESFSESKVDFVVKGEGELTLLELIKAIKHKGKLDKIKGIAYRTKEEVKINPDRELIKDLDSLPFPAYDLLPMHLYGKYSTNHKDFAAIEHGRGCWGGCNFCSIWPQMAEKGKPFYRTKSAKRSYEETKWLVEKYGRKTLNWVDGTFNMDTKWSKEYFDLLEKNGIKVQHTAWMRADCIVRDEKLGIMELMARNGLVQSVVGMERFDNESINKLGKKNTCIETNKEAFRILRDKYPSVYTIATLIYGMPEDDWKDLFRINKLIHSKFTDMIFMLPYTPYPGTSLWNKYKDKFSNDDLKRFNLHLPVLGTKKISRWLLDKWFKLSLLDYVILRPGNLIRRVTKEKDLRKRNVQKSLAMKIFRLGTQFVCNRLTFQKGKELDYGIKPSWYDK
jgi:radical SAM superfamily enzyme YgiQ (UPF0313 family)